jgi:uncharacterized protein
MMKALKMMMVLWLIFCAGLAQATSYDRPKIQLPGPQGFVSDHAHAIDGDWKERIRSVCQDLERKTGVEMVVVTVPTIKPFESANEYATALYEKWGIGSTQQEHGVMVLVAVQERQAAITLGRQMLPVITPMVVNQVGRESLQPSIELGHFGEGLYLTVVALASPAQEVRVGIIAKTLLLGSPSFAASWRSRSSGGSPVQTFGIPTNGFKKASIGGPGRVASVEISAGSAGGQAGKGISKRFSAWPSHVTCKDSPHI